MFRHKTPLPSPRTRFHIEDCRFSFAVTVRFTYNFYVSMIFADNRTFRIIYDIPFTISATFFHRQTHNRRNFYKSHKTPLPERDLSRSGLPNYFTFFSSCLSAGAFASASSFARILRIIYSRLDLLVSPSGVKFCTNSTPNSS